MKWFSFGSQTGTDPKDWCKRIWRSTYRVTIPYKGLLKRHRPPKIDHDETVNSILVEDGVYKLTHCVTYLPYIHRIMITVF